MNVVFLICYEVVLWCLALVALPKMIYSFVVHKKYRQSLFPRLGWRYPISEKLLTPSIWIHAVSMGEVKAIVSLARELKQRFPKHPLIISTTTETGQVEAKRSLPFADYHVYLPIDFRLIVYKMMRRASPRLVILCETDFWFNFLSCAKRQGASLALVNGKMSERSMKRFRCVSFFSRRLFALLDSLCVQNVLYRDRFVEAGACSERVVVTGNLKLDDDYPQLCSGEVTQWRQKLGIQPGQIVLTVGSTHAPEEQEILQLLKKIWKRHPELRVILVPRHPERFKEVVLLLERERLSWVSFTDISRRTGQEQVILMDVMGLLRMCYQLSDIAIVGGSFTDRVGGHNILEPCWYGKPVICGPYMQGQLELLSLLKGYKAGLQVDQGQLQWVLENWIEHPEECRGIGERGLDLVKDLKGSTRRTLEVLEPCLARSGC